MGSQNDFWAIYHEMVRLYNEKLFAEALALVESKAGAYPEQLARTTFWRACLLSLDNRAQDALAVIKKGLDEGLWWHESQFRDSDFNPIREMPEFKALVARSHEQCQLARGQTKPERAILVPDGSGPYPLLIALHGYSGNKDYNLENWEVARQKGWLVLSPQSTLAVFVGGYYWGDIETGIRDIRCHLDDVLREYPIDQTRVVIGGMSQGSGMAILTALQPEIGARGFIGVGTWWGDMDSLTSAAKAQSTRGYFITGLKDHTLERAREIQAVLKATGSIFEEEIHPDLGHDFPPDFGTAFDQAIHFLWS